MSQPVLKTKMFWTIQTERKLQLIMRKFIVLLLLQFESVLFIIFRLSQYFNTDVWDTVPLFICINWISWIIFIMTTIYLLFQSAEVEK